MSRIFRKFTRLLVSVVKNEANKSLPMCSVCPALPRCLAEVSSVCRYAETSRAAGSRLIFLLVERLVPFGQQAIDLAGRDVHSQFQQFLVQQRLGDVVVKMLVERILPERRTEMRLDVLRQGSGDDRPVRQLVAAAAVPRVVRLEPQVLDGEILIAEELGAVGQVVEQQRLDLMNHQLSCLGAFGGAGPFSVGRVRFLLLSGSRWRAAGVVERAGARLAFRLIRQSLQPPDLVFELVDSQLLLLDRRPQLPFVPAVDQ